MYNYWPSWSGVCNEKKEVSKGLTKQTNKSTYIFEILQNRLRPQLTPYIVDINITLINVNSSHLKLLGQLKYNGLEGFLAGKVDKVRNNRKVPRHCKKRTSFLFCTVETLPPTGPFSLLRLLSCPRAGGVTTPSYNKNDLYNYPCTHKECIDKRRYKLYKISNFLIFVWIFS